MFSATDNAPFAAKRFDNAFFLAISAGIAGGMLFAFLSNQTSALMGFAICLGLLFSCAALSRPELALGLTIFVIPIERLGRLTNDSSMYTVSLMRIVGLLTLIAFIVNAFALRKHFRFGSAFFLYLLYSAIAVSTVVHTNDFSGAVRASGAIIGNLLFFFLIINMVRDWKQVRLALVIWLLASVLVGVYTIYNWHFGGQSNIETEIGNAENRFNTVLADTSEIQSLNEIPRASGTTSHPAVFGINNVLTLPFFAYLFRISKSKLAITGQALGMMVILYNIFLTNTRAVLIVAFLVLLIAVAMRLVRFSLGRLVTAALIVAAILPFVPSAVYDRVLNVSNYTLDRSATLRIRLEYWSAGVEIAKQNWLFGIGVGNQKTVPEFIKSITAKETSVHCEYLETLMETGVPGWLIFFGFVATIYSAAHRTGRKLKHDPERENQYWFIVACKIAIIITLLFGVQVDVFHFPLKGWWLIASLTWVVHLLVRDEADTKTETHRLRASSLGMSTVSNVH